MTSTGSLSFMRNETRGPKQAKEDVTPARCKASGDRANERGMQYLGTAVDSLYRRP